MKDKFGEFARSVDWRIPWVTRTCVRFVFELPAKTVYRVTVWSTASVGNTGVTHCVYDRVWRWRGFHAGGMIIIYTRAPYSQAYKRKADVGVGHLSVVSTLVLSVRPWYKPPDATRFPPIYFRRLSHFVFPRSVCTARNSSSTDRLVHTPAQPRPKAVRNWRPSI